jgi:hypothetical protein
MASPQQQKLDLALKGLYTSPNNLSAIPQGALEIADNVVINNQNIVDSRRGQTQYGAVLSVGSGEINKIFNYATSLIVSYDNKLAYDSDNAGTFVNYSGTYTPPSTDFKMRSLEAQRNFYFTTSLGIYKLDEIDATPRKAGVVQALSGSASLSGASGFMANNSAVAYRLVWGYIDANDNLILGAPSQRLIISNSSGGTRDVSLSFIIPDTITTEYFYQIYRSQGTATATDEPTDELQLVVQGNPTSAEITAKSFTVIDITPYSLMRATLYTSPSQEGIAQANYQPPFAVDMDVFKNYAFYANVRQKQKLTLAVIAVDLPALGYYVDATTDTTNGSPTLTAIASTADLHIGMRCVGTGIPADTYIIAIPGANSVTMSRNATATATVSVEFQDEFSIGGVDYYAGTANDTATNTFKVDLAGTPAQNINETCLNLIQVINTSPSNSSIYAYYISALDDLPGQMYFEERTIGGSAFIATSTSGDSFSPVLPTKKKITANTLANPTVITSTGNAPASLTNITIYGSNSTPTIDGARVVTNITADTFSVPVNVTVAGTSGYFLLTSELVISNNDAKQNRAFVSKRGQIEAVPLLQFFDIGSANFAIKRCIALRDGIFFFKQDGVFRLSGESIENFTVSLVDNTTALLCPESAVPFNNQIFCFTDQGICAVSDTGVEIKSVPIENTLLELSSEQYTNFATASFGVAYESARQYMFFTVTEEDDAFATQAFVYNSLTNSWTRWVMNRTCGVVGASTNKLYMGEAETGQVLIERKNYTRTDFADQQFAINIVSVDSDTELTLTSAANVVAGMTLVQGFRESIVTEVNSNVITINEISGLTTGAAIVYQPIENKIKYAPIDVENPGILKQFCEISLFFRNAAFENIDATFQTNISGQTRTVEIMNNSNNGWGAQNWGEFAWGGSLGGQAVLRTYVPREQMRGHWLSLTLETNEAFTSFSLQGLSVMFNTMGSRIK